MVINAHSIDNLILHLPFYFSAFSHPARPLEALGAFFAPRGDFLKKSKNVEIFAWREKKSKRIRSKLFCEMKGTSIWSWTHIVSITWSSSFFSIFWPFLTPPRPLETLGAFYAHTGDFSKKSKKVKIFACRKKNLRQSVPNCFRKWKALV